MKPIREVIAQAIRDSGFDPLAMTAEQGAEEIVAALREAGYFIGINRTDPEGGIPGRS